MERSILLTRLSVIDPDQGRWTLPGGGREPGESHFETLRREFDEETGLEPRIGSLLEVLSWDRPATETRGPLHVVQYVYAVHTAGEPIVREVGGSTAEAAWVRVDEMRRLPLVDLAEWALARIGESLGGQGAAGGLGTIAP